MRVTLGLIGACGLLFFLWTVIDKWHALGVSWRHSREVLTVLRYESLVVAVALLVRWLTLVRAPRYSAARLFTLSVMCWLSFLLPFVLLFTAALISHWSDTATQKSLWD